MAESSNASDNLDFLRDVAQSGLSAPLLGGRFFIWWGSLAAITLTLHWSILTGVLPLGEPWLGGIWALYGLVGMGGSFILRKTLKGKPGAGATPVRAERAVWTGMATLVTAWAIGSVVSNLFGGGYVLLYDTIPLVAFLGYGIAFTVTAALGGPGWMRLTGFASYLAAGGGLLLVGAPEVYLYCAAVAAILTVLPGIVLLRGEPPAET